MLFVYGTLRAGARNRHVIEPLLKSSRPVRVRGILYVYGKYPLFFPGESGAVAGELVELKDEYDMAGLDKFEGPEYRRIEISAGGEKAWVYTYKEKTPPLSAKKIESGDWIAHMQAKE